MDKNLSTTLRLTAFSKVLGLVLISAVKPRAEGNIGDFIFHHIGNSDSWHYLPGAKLTLPAKFMVGPINMGITLHVLMILLAGIFMLFIFSIAGKRRNFVPVNGIGHVVEAFIIYLRDEIVIPNLGRKESTKWLPFFLTLFFFILILNLLGMIPGMSVATANINLTGSLAILIFLCYNLAGMANNGPFQYFANLTPKGIPWPILIILAPIEFLGLFTKAFALAIRLFANMSAGHIVILSLLALISILKSWLVVPISLGFALFISLIEILVAFLQAYVFTLLSALFVGMAIHQEH